MRDHYAPFPVGETFRIVPPGTPPVAGRRDLVMDRGAFGSGEHETTVSCLELLETFPFAGSERVLDLGSGTGILAIAALQRGAGRAWCVDIEPEAVASCRRNCVHNGVADRAEHCCGTLDAVAGDGFDLVLANIYGDILLAVAADLVGRARPGAKLLLSGILWEYNFDVRQRYRRLGCREVKNRMLEEFSTVLLEKAGQAGAELSTSGPAW